MTTLMASTLSKYTNEQSRFVVVDGNLVHYRDEGKGYPLVCLHGAFASLHTFDGWAEALKDDFRIIRLDMYGFGLTGAPQDGTYTIEKQVELVYKVLSILKVKKCVIAGNSLGGWVSWEFCLKYPKMVRKLILVDSAGFLEMESIPLPFKMARTPFLNKVIKYVIKRNILEQFVYQVYGEPEKITTELIDRYYDLFNHDNNPKAFLEFVNKTEFIDHTAQLKNIKCPTLIMWGEEDQWIPIDYAHRFLEKIPKARLVIYEHTGHIPMEEIPEISAAEVKRFIFGGGK